MAPTDTPASVPAKLAGPKVKAFTDVTVVAMDSDKPLLHHTVVVEGGSITKLCMTDRDLLCTCDSFVITVAP